METLKILGSLYAHIDEDPKKNTEYRNKVRTRERVELRERARERMELRERARERVESRERARECVKRREQSWLSGAREPDQVPGDCAG